MHKRAGREKESVLYLEDADMSQFKVIRGIILGVLGLSLFVGFFIPFQMTHAAVLYEQSKIGTAYDIFEDVGTGVGFYSKFPQYSGEGEWFPGGGEPYSGTAAWLRVKRLSGLSCTSRFTVGIVATDGVTRIGGQDSLTVGTPNGDYCDFPIAGYNRTDMAVGAIFICLDGDCNDIPSFVLDGSPENEGYVVDGTQVMSQKGGWAFQICDSDGCEGGFEEVSACGDIIYPADYYYEGSDEEKTAIEDCDNPFNADQTVNFTATLMINNQLVTNDATINVTPETRTVPYALTMTPDSAGKPLAIYRKEGADYVLVPPAMSSSSLAGTIDLSAGDYVAVLTYKEATIPLGYHKSPTIFEKLAALVVPTAQAFYPDYQEVQAINFTVVETELETSGASSVLFLPGIQASRLYTEGLLGTEDELWVPNWNQDVRQLDMTTEGESMSSVYTRDILDQVVGVGTVYQSFSQKMDDLVAGGIIADWEPYAYDWRYAVDTVVRDGARYEGYNRSILTLLESLADDSFSGKVTIVAHSNGGLLAKALLAELQNQHKEHLVDKLVLLASPQLGTPKAVGSLLHGLDQEAAGGLVIDASVARSVTKNMPGTYGLLPTVQYFDAVGKPIIYFSSEQALDQFRDAYGESIDTLQELSQFLLGTGDQRPEPSTIYDAEILNSDMYNNSQLLHQNILQTWKAPSSTKVYEVVGVGLNTISGFEYKEFKERVCSTELFTETCTDQAYYKPIIIPSLYGDETVMAQSAKGYQGDKETYFVDFALIRQVDPKSRFRHVNFTEAPAVQDFVTRVIKNEALTDIQFLSETAVVPNVDYGVLSLNSPATVRVTNKKGEIAEIVFADSDFVEKREEIPNSNVYYFGSTTYIVLPFDDTYTIEVIGTGPGGMTIALDSVDNETLKTQYHLWLPDTQQGMTVSGDLTQGILSELSIDANGDGNTDYNMDPQTGIRQSVDLPIVTSTKASKTGTKVSVRRVPEEQVAGVSTSNPNIQKIDYYQRLYVLLAQLSLLLEEYEKSI